jgi:tRNA (guanine-N7-)-methyltransferase
MHAPRRIRSFVLRAGRVTPAQERALADLWPQFGLDFTGERIDLHALFGHAADQPRSKRCVEIGFGAGEVLGALAAANPATDHLGIEVHRSGVGRLLLNAEQAKLTNLRVVRHDAVEVLSQGIDDDSLDEILVFFPDPWHKKRHHKRRLIEAGFVALLAAKMAPGAVLRLATDWQAYAEQMLAVCNANERLESLAADRGYVPRPDLRPLTRFEKRGARLGHGVWDLAYVKTR